MPRLRPLALIALIALPLPGAAQTALPAGVVPEAAPSVQTDAPALRMATGPFSDGRVPVQEALGPASHRAWHWSATEQTPREILAPARAALIAAGYDLVLECGARDCGGFDFRYTLPVLPEPDMHIDLGRYHYLAARKGDLLVALWASRAPETAFLQISTGVGPLTAPHEAALILPHAPDPISPRPTARPGAEDSVSASAETTDTTAPQTPPDPTAPAPDALFPDGHLVLDGIAFAPGSAALTDPEAPVLARLAGWLEADPARGLVLVGHTDATGALAGNIAISKARAAAVRARLISAHGIAPDRILAEGAGWLAPRASNAAAEGQALNRRVEALPR